MLDIWSVAAVNDLDVAVLILGQYSACFLVEAVLYKFYACGKIHLHRVSAAWQRYIPVTILDIWSESSLRADYVDSLMLTHVTWKLEKFTSLLKSDAFNPLSGSKAAILH